MGCERGKTVLGTEDTVLQEYEQLITKDDSSQFFAFLGFGSKRSAGVKIVVFCLDWGS
jgi:hypothetical protein